MSKFGSVYDGLKGVTYDWATACAKRTNPDAQTDGFKDVFDLIMSDSDHARQSSFLMGLSGFITTDQSKVLLDGLAREYAGLEGWMAYVERESS
jgi:hypothetical protein